jgi:uncharacterized membrane protein
MIMLAETTAPDPKAFLQFWLILGLIFSVLANIVTPVVILSGIGRKQKREVNFAVEPASKVEFDQHVIQNQREHENIFSRLNGADRGHSGQFERVRQEMHEMELRINKSSEERTEKTHNRINEVLEAVSELRGQVRGDEVT